MSDRQVAMELSHNGASERQSAGSKQGSVVSFHNIHYKVKQGGGCLCWKKTTTKDILVDLNHEYISGYYRLSVYFLSKILLDILTLRTIPAVIFSCVSYFMTGLKPTAEAFFLFMLTVALVAYTATSMTMAISVDQEVVAMATMFINFFFVFMMIFTGWFVNLPSMVSWLAWLKYLSIPQYGFAALQINEFPGLKFCKEFNNSFTPGGHSCTGEEVLDAHAVDYSTWGFWQNHLALAIMSVCFLAIAYFKLRFIKKFT